MRNHIGNEATPGMGIEVHGSHYENLPLITCSKCGKQFRYRGIQDSDSVNGTTWNSETGEYEVSGSSSAICDECAQMLNGGPLSGKANWEIK